MGNSKKKKEANILYEFDKSLDQKYVGLLEEIQFMQADIKREERKAQKREKKKMKKGNTFYDPRAEVRVRQQVIREMEGGNFFDRVIQAINDIRPICMVIARLVMTLIISILSIDSVKYRIKPDTLNKMHSVYDMAHRVAQAG